MPFAPAAWAPSGVDNQRALSGVSRKVSFYDPIAAPASPSQVNDEFTGSLNPLWIPVNWGLPTTKALSGVRNLVLKGSGNGDSLIGNMQPLPVGDFTAVLMWSYMSAGSADSFAGICLADGYTVGAGTQHVLFWTSNPAVAIYPWTNYATAGAQAAWSVVASKKGVRLSRLGATYYYYHTTDGYTWTLFNSASTPAFTPAYIGFVTKLNSAGFEVDLSYFRLYNTATPADFGGGVTVPLSS